MQELAGKTLYWGTRERYGNGRGVQPVEFQFVCLSGRGGARHSPEGGDTLRLVSRGRIVQRNCDERGGGLGKRCTGFGYKGEFIKVGGTTLSGGIKQARKGLHG